MLKHDDGSVTLSPSEWKRVVLLFDDERDWSEEELINAVKDGGWIEGQPQAKNEQGEADK